MTKELTRAVATYQRRKAEYERAVADCSIDVRTRMAEAALFNAAVRVAELTARHLRRKASAL